MQALWRRFAQSELVPEYEVPGSDVRTAFKMVGALPFVPIDDLDAFSAYFVHTWMGTSASAPMFDQWSWNQYEVVLAGLPRTTHTLVLCSTSTLQSRAPHIVWAAAV